MSAKTEPLEFGEHRIFRRRHWKSSRVPILIDGFDSRARCRRAIEGTTLRHEQIDLEHRGQVNEIARRSDGHRGSEAILRDVVGGLQPINKSFDVTWLEFGNQIGVQTCPRDPMSGTGDGAANVLANAQRVERFGDGPQRRDEIRFGHSLWMRARSRRSRSVRTASARSEP